MRKNAGKGRRNDLVCLGRDRDCRGDADEEQQRGHKEPTANTKHTGQNTNKTAQSEKDKSVHRYFGNGQIDVHGASYAALCRLGKRLTPRSSI